MPIHFTFIGQVISVTGMGAFKTAKVAHEDSEGSMHEVGIKYYQNADNTLSPDRFYLFNGNVIFVQSSNPKVGLRNELHKPSDQSH